jgi:hypothetical protein
MLGDGERYELNGGAPILSVGGSKMGVFGLLVSDANGALYAISHRDLCQAAPGTVAGKPGRILLHLDRLGAAKPSSLSLGHQSVCSLVSAYRVDAGTRVSAMVPSLGDQGVADAQPPIKALGERLRLVVGQAFTEWRIVALAGQACFLGPNGEKRFYDDVVECAALTPGAQPPGAGGAVFFTPIGAPVGMLVGWREDIALVAPLRSVLREAGLGPVSAATALAHNSLMLAPPVRAPSLAPVATPSIATVSVPRELAPEAVVVGARSYRLEPPRPALPQSAGEELDASTWRLRSPASKPMSTFSADAVKAWLVTGLKRSEAASTQAELRAAFQPVMLVNPGRPAKELMEAIGASDPSRREEIAKFCIQRVIEGRRRMPWRERALMWWMVHDFLVRSAGKELDLDLQAAVFRAVSTCLPEALGAFKAEPASAELADEIFAIVELARALPPVTYQALLVERRTRWSAFEPSKVAIAATRLFLAALRDGDRDLPAAIRNYDLLLAWIRGYERGLLAISSNIFSRIDQMFGLAGQKVGELEQEALGRVRPHPFLAVLDGRVRAGALMKRRLGMLLRG